MCGYVLALIDAKPAAAKLRVINCNKRFPEYEMTIKCNIVSSYFVSYL